LVQAAFGSRQHFLCAGSFRFCYWLSMTTTFSFTFEVRQNG
jgi:hypothetical protein